MKKVYALLLVAVMTVAMAVPTFAANSPEADPVVKTAAGVDVVAAAKEVKTSVAAASVAVPCIRNLYRIRAERLKRSYQR